MTTLKAIPLGLIALFPILSGCSGGAVNIGDQNDAQVVAKSGLDAFVGNWSGYAEAYSFVDGTDQVRISIKSDGSATLRFGKQELWSLPTDPNADFIPRFDGYDYTKYTAAEIGNINPPLVGFNYTLKSVQFDNDRIRAAANHHEVYEHWCSLQTPNMFEGGQYKCVKNCHGYNLGSLLGGGTYVADGCYGNTCLGSAPDEPWTRIPCDQYYLCWQAVACTCDSNSCALSTYDSANDMSLDAAIGDQQQSLSGTLVFQWSTRTSLNIRLKRE